MKRKTSQTPTRIITYGCLPPIEGAERLHDQLFHAHRYQQDLTAVELRARAEYRDARCKVAKAARCLRNRDTALSAAALDTSAQSQSKLDCFEVETPKPTTLLGAQSGQFKQVTRSRYPRFTGTSGRLVCQTVMTESLWTVRVPVERQSDFEKVLAAMGLRVERKAAGRPLAPGHVRHSWREAEPGRNECTKCGMQRTQVGADYTFVGPDGAEIGTRRPFGNKTPPCTEERLPVHLRRTAGH
jgi:hypothetical protein